MDVGSGTDDTEWVGGDVLQTPSDVGSGKNERETYGDVEATRPAVVNVGSGTDERETFRDVSGDALQTSVDAGCGTNQ